MREGDIERILEHAKTAVQDHVRAHTGGVWQELAGSAPSIGSFTCIRIADRLFIATAAHNFKDLRKGGKVTIFSGSRRSTTSLNIIGNNYSEYGDKGTLDCAWLEVDLDSAQRAKLEVATAGYAMGEDALIVYDKITQISPLLRHGVISSNYPYPGPSPHGFTTDIMTQGGESGSPFFQPDTGSVIGLLHSGFDGTNVTIGIPSWIVKSALDSCLEDYPFEFGGSPTLADIMKNPRPTMPLNWETVILPAPPAPPKDED